VPRWSKYFNVGTNICDCPDKLHIGFFTHNDGDCEICLFNEELYFSLFDDCFPGLKYQGNGTNDCKELVHDKIYDFSCGFSF
jgi:hypothetical protein